MALMLVAAPVAGRMYHSPDLFGLVAVLAIALPIAALPTVPYVKLRAAMDFRFLATYSSGEMLAVQVASVALAALGCGAYSFVLPAPSPRRSRRRCSGARRRPGSGPLPPQADQPLRQQRLPRARHAADRRGGQPGRLRGARPDGDGHGGGSLFLRLPPSGAAVADAGREFRRGAVPGLHPAPLRAEPERHEAAALRASRVLAFLVTPVCFLQAAFAAPALHLMYGARWNGANPLMQVLSLGLPGDAVAWVAGALLVARREFLRDFILLAAFSPPFFIFVLAGAYLGSSLGVPIGASLYYALVKPINSWLVLRRSMVGRFHGDLRGAPAPRRGGGRRRLRDLPADGPGAGADRGHRGTRPAGLPGAAPLAAARHPA